MSESTSAEHRREALRLLAGVHEEDMHGRHRVHIQSGIRLCLSNTVIVGDDNEVYGNNNLIVGDNNTCRGSNNRSRGDRNKLFGTHCTNYDTGRRGVARGGFSARIRVAPALMSARFIKLSVSMCQQHTMFHRSTFSSSHNASDEMETAHTPPRRHRRKEKVVQ